MNLVLIYKLEAHGGGTTVAAIITIQDLLDFHSLAISFRCFLSPVCTVSEAERRIVSTANESHDGIK